ncbi:DUF3137 domain-containing protein [Spiroplasma alleghenense]|uniref:DUF3137 domain-containing protein n=1 Tax=Spiroplasma alleghenense TaxID=216931 RepID=A0A345Z5B4_9MOLU|nr:DUF3137 domain-containing protein [Spiroplasma alleghenense]AXK51793.1 hypothetical protein SALLE_v1c11230 [Spiroplasma alleghenense]
MNKNYESLKQLIKEDVEDVFKDSNKKIRRPWLGFFIIGVILIIISPIIWGILTATNQAEFNSWWKILLVMVLPVIGAFLAGFYQIQLTNFKKKLKSQINFNKYYKAGLQISIDREVNDCLIQNNKITSAFDLKEYSHLDSSWKLSKNHSFLNFDFKNFQASYGVVNYERYVNKKHEYCKQEFFQLICLEADKSHDFEMFFKTYKFNLDKGHNKVSLESTEFNKLVNLYSSDQIEARKVFPPIKMQKVLDSLNQKDKARFRFLFVKKNTIFGQIKTFNAKHAFRSDFNDFKYDKDNDKLVDNIYKKITQELADINQINDFLNILELY